MAKPPNESAPPDGYYGIVTKRQALDQLVELDGSHPNEATALQIMTAVQHGATLNEVADRLGISTETLESDYPGAIDEAGRIGHFRHPDGDPAVSEAVKPLYVSNR